MTAYNPDNVFARILRGEIPAKTVFENDYALAFHDVAPQAPVHILIIPKGPFLSFSDFNKKASSDEIAGFFKAVSHVAALANVHDSGYRLITNNGTDAGQEVPHFHVHLLAGKPLGPLLSPGP